MLRYANGAGLRNAGDRTLTRVDPATGETQPVGGVAPCGLTADPSGDVWVANCYAPGPSANVVRVDADSLEFEETLPVPAGPGFVRGMSYGGGSLWLTDVNGDVAPEERRVFQVDPGTRMSRSIPFKLLPTWLTWSDGYGDLWVGHIGNGSVSRLHTETGEVDTKKSVAQGPGYLMVHRDALWSTRLAPMSSASPRSDQDDHTTFRCASGRGLQGSRLSPPAPAPSGRPCPTTTHCGASTKGRRSALESHCGTSRGASR